MKNATGHAVSRSRGYVVLQDIIGFVVYPPTRYVIRVYDDARASSSSKTGLNEPLQIIISKRVAKKETSSQRTNVSPQRLRDPVG
jgi:hypothetical protein